MLGGETNTAQARSLREINRLLRTHLKSFVGYTNDDDDDDGERGSSTASLDASLDMAAYGSDDDVVRGGGGRGGGGGGASAGGRDVFAFDSSAASFSLASMRALLPLADAQQSTAEGESVRTEHHILCAIARVLSLVHPPEGYLDDDARPRPLKDAITTIIAARDPHCIVELLAAFTSTPHCRAHRAFRFAKIIFRKFKRSAAVVEGVLRLLETVAPRLLTEETKRSYDAATQGGMTQGSDVRGHAEKVIHPQQACGYRYISSESCSQCLTRSRLVPSSTLSEKPGDIWVEALSKVSALPFRFIRIRLLRCYVATVLLPDAPDKLGNDFSKKLVHGVQLKNGKVKAWLRDASPLVREAAAIAAKTLFGAYEDHQAIFKGVVEALPPLRPDSGADGDGNGDSMELEEGEASAVVLLARDQERTRALTIAEIAHSSDSVDRDAIFMLCELWRRPGLQPLAARLLSAVGSAVGFREAKVRSLLEQHIEFIVAHWIAARGRLADFPAILFEADSLPTFVRVALSVVLPVVVVESAVSVSLFYLPFVHVSCESFSQFDSLPRYIFEGGGERGAPRRGRQRGGQRAGGGARQPA